MPFVIVKTRTIFSYQVAKTQCIWLKQKYRKFPKAELFWTVSPDKYLTFPSPLSPDREQAEGVKALKEQECSLISKLTGVSLRIHQDVARVIFCTWDLLRLLHPKLHGRLLLIHGPLALVIQHESTAAGVNGKVLTGYSEEESHGEIVLQLASSSSAQQWPCNVLSSLV